MSICTLDEITSKPLQVSPSDNPTAPFSYVDISSVNNRAKIVEQPQTLLGADAPSRARKLLRAGDVIVSMTRPNLNAVALIGGELTGAVASTGFAVLRPTDRIVPEFLFQVVQTPRFVNSMVQLTAGQMYPAVSERDVRSFSIELPPLDEQRRIVDLLNRVVSLKRLSEDAQAKSVELIPALFVDMFGEPTTNPKSWPTAPLAEVAKVSSGAGFPKADQGRAGEQFPFLKVSDMNLPGNGRVIRTWNNSVSEQTRSRLRAKAFPPGSVIFPKIGAAIATNKKRILERASCVDNNVMAVCPGEELGSAYLHGLLLLKNISDFASKSDPPSMRQSEVEAWSIPLPPRDLQYEYAMRLAILESIEALADRSSQTAERTRAALMARLFAS